MLMKALQITLVNDSCLYTKPQSMQFRKSIIYDLCACMNVSEQSKTDSVASILCGFSFFKVV